MKLTFRCLPKSSISRWVVSCGWFYVFFVIACFGVLRTTQAVSPPPDGGYSGENTAEGTSALLHLNGGTNNTALGWASLGFDVTGNLNTAVGAGALLFNGADENTATGAGALLSNTAGGPNTANGAFALFSNTNGTNNNAFGTEALFNNTSGFDNVALGDGAGFNQTTGGGNVYIGAGMLGVAGESNTCYIGSIFGQTVAAGLPVLIDSNNKLGTNVSSKRFKQNIKSMGKVSEAILALKPVTFHYKNDKTNTAQFGLIAEEVAASNPDLVVHDKEGRPYAVRYDQVNAMLLNEFLKEHKKVQEQQARISERDSRVARQEARIAQ